MASIEASPSGISGPGRAELAAALARSGGVFVTPQDVAEELSVGGVAAAQRLARWAGAGWLRRVRRGLYVAVPVDAQDPATWSVDPLVVAARVWPDCYFTGWTAAGQWGLTEQVFRVTVLRTAGRVRAARVVLLGSEYLVGRVADADLRWGMRTQWRDSARLRFADPARTVVDILDDPAIGGGMRHAADILDTYLLDNDPGLLIDYAGRIGNATVFKRLGYLTEVLRPDLADLVASAVVRISAGVTTLDPTAPATGRVDRRWNLRINATITPAEPS